MTTRGLLGKCCKGSMSGNLDLDLSIIKPRNCQFNYYICKSFANIKVKW